MILGWRLGGLDDPAAESARRRVATGARDVTAGALGTRPSEVPEQAATALQASRAASSRLDDRLVKARRDRASPRWLEPVVFGGDPDRVDSVAGGEFVCC
jgi:hypothetical protein